MERESGKVEAYIFLTIYNGTFKDKKVVFDIDTRYEEQYYSERVLKDDMYKVTKIEILDGEGQVDTENMILSIPSHKEVHVSIEAENTYVGEEYQGEEIYLSRAATYTSFHVVE